MESSIAAPEVCVGAPDWDAYYEIVKQEVRRRIALGVPPSLDPDELLSTANSALVSAVAAGARDGALIRVTVRRAMNHLLRHERTIRRHRADIEDAEPSSARNKARVAIPSADVCG